MIAIVAPPNKKYIFKMLYEIKYDFFLFDF